MNAFPHDARPPARMPDIDEAWLAKTVAPWPGAAAAWKPEWETFVLTVAGKIFGMFGGGSGECLLTVKGDPLENVALRQTYPEIIPGYHVNKTHWISVRLGRCTLSHQHLAELVEESYSLVYASLTTRLQAEIRAEHARGVLAREG